MGRRGTSGLAIASRHLKYSGIGFSCGNSSLLLYTRTDCSWLRRETAARREWPSGARARVALSAELKRRSERSPANAKSGAALVALRPHHTSLSRFQSLTLLVHTSHGALARPVSLAWLAFLRQLLHPQARRRRRGTLHQPNSRPASHEPVQARQRKWNSWRLSFRGFAAACCRLARLPAQR